MTTVNNVQQDELVTGGCGSLRAIEHRQLVKQGRRDGGRGAQKVDSTKLGRRSSQAYFLSDQHGLTVPHDSGGEPDPLLG